MNGTVYVISAPSGCGKTTLNAALIATTSHLTLAVSHTTREARSREVPGIHYHFISIAKFQRMIEDQQFLEYAKVFGHYYGTSTVELDNVLAQGKDVLLEIDWQGMKQVKQYYPRAVTIFILPPSLNALKERLIQRKQDNLSVIEERVKQAVREISHYKEYEYIVENNQFDKALKDMQSIIIATRLRSDKQRVLAGTLLNNY